MKLFQTKLYSSFLLQPPHSESLYGPEVGLLSAPRHARCSHLSISPLFLHFRFAFVILSQESWLISTAKPIFSSLPSLSLFLDLLHLKQVNVKLSAIRCLWQQHCPGKLPSTINFQLYLPLFIYDKTWKDEIRNDFPFVWYAKDEVYVTACWPSSETDD